MLLPLVLGALALLQTPQTVPAQPDLTAVIVEQDAALFSVMFERCDPPALTALLTADFEFYHDKGGAMFGRQAFIDDYARSCRERQAPDAWRSRRALVGETLRVYPVPGYGAVEEGSHLFHERRGGGPENLTGRARFSIVWKLDADGAWRAARVLSVDHGPASD